MKKPVLSIVVPCFNESEILNESIQKLNEKLKNLIKTRKISEKSFISLINDGSSDDSWAIIKQISSQPNIKGIKLSRNYGHQTAIFAGLVQNEADIFITIDADLQDDINLIEKMVDEYLKGNEIVYCIRDDRSEDSFSKRVLAQTYYKFARRIGVQCIYNHADYRLISSKIVNILKESKEHNIFLRGVIPSLGFKTSCLYFKRNKRIGGTNKYNLYSSSMLALDGIYANSKALLNFLSILLALFSVMSFILFSKLCITYLEANIINTNNLIIFGICFISTIQLLISKILGGYIYRIFNSTKGYRSFYIDEKT